jgi:CheY-like chemotaxis protein
MPTILVIDDSEMQRKIAKIYIEKSGDCECHFAFDGKEGYEKALELNPDLILLDIEMPVCDGVTTLKNLKSNPASAKIPVVMCSSVKKEDVINECMRLGAMDFMSKPHGFIKIQALLKKLDQGLK